MPQVRLILALHDHQPVGNFDGVFEAAYRDSYLPFLEVLEGYPEIPFVLHTSGPLLEWLVENRPEYIERVRALVEAGRVEILGGGFYEPILTMIPHRDRVGQIRGYADHLQDVFGTAVRGMWIPERVWEQHVVSALAEAGVEYTVLDDFHFQRAGLGEAELLGYYLTEDEGKLLKVFPGSERLRYLMPFQEPHATYEYLHRLAHEQPGATVVFADDGEKFGAWPETFHHVYTHGWLRRFCDMLIGNRQWLQTTTLSRAVDSTLPLGKIYLPDSSYREMTEWALPASRQAEYLEAVRETAGQAAAERLKPFLRAGGFWRNFKARYAESDEMYARMLGLSERLASAWADGRSDPDYLEVARQELYRSQCNCPYWHGAFGGLYLPHLRNAIYYHLIAAETALDDAAGRTGPRVAIEAGDFNLDARQEVRIENDQLVALVRPATGGQIYELDIRQPHCNLLATLERRPEAYHQAIAAAAQGPGQDYHGPAGVQNRVILKQEGLDRLLVYDRTPRKALVDHFYPADVTLEDLRTCRDVERGDFVAGAYLSRLNRSPNRVALVMERPGWADGHPVHVRKTIAIEAGSPALDVHYVLEGLPRNAPLHFAIEINVAGLAGHAPDRYYSDVSGSRLGMLDTPLDLPETDGLRLTDEWLGVSTGLSWSHPADLWCFPIETVSQSEGGFEGVYQSSAVVPHWRVTADAAGRWDLAIRWTIDRMLAPAPAEATAGETQETLAASRAGIR
jgi:alpha-amylase